MKRFYCTVCKKIKRVRQYPANIQDAHATFPADRIGSCNRHELSEYQVKIARLERRKAGA
jgi:hypothetical protein